MIDTRGSFRPPSPDVIIAQNVVNLEFPEQLDMRLAAVGAAHRLEHDRAPDIYSMGLGGLAVTGELPLDLQFKLGEKPYLALTFQSVKHPAKHQLPAVSIGLQGKGARQQITLTNEPSSPDQGWQQPFAVLPIDCKKPTTQLPCSELVRGLDSLLQFRDFDTNPETPHLLELVEPRSNFRFSDIVYEIGHLLAPHAKQKEISYIYSASDFDITSLDLAYASQLRASLKATQKDDMPTRYELSLATAHDIRGTQVLQHVSYSFTNERKLTPSLSHRLIAQRGLNPNWLKQAGGIMARDLDVSSFGRQAVECLAPASRACRLD